MKNAKKRRFVGFRVGSQSFLLSRRNVLGVNFEGRLIQIPFFPASGGAPPGAAHQPLLRPKAFILLADGQYTGIQAAGTASIKRTGSSYRHSALDSSVVTICTAYLSAGATS